MLLLVILTCVVDIHCLSLVLTNGAVLEQVTMVKWNEPYQKLASCDSTGIIFVWIKYEGR